jgi:hypothetical protein
MIRAGLKGSVPACIEICDRVERKVRQTVIDVEDEFADKSIEKLEAELERSRAEHSGDPDTKTPPDGSYTQ